MSRVLIMAGGTGGHVFPALAVARELQDQGVEVQWLGTKRGIESRLVPEAAIRLHCIEVEGVRGKGKLSLIMAPLKLLKALWQARAVLKLVQPDAVIGFGGFASGPGGFVAWLTGVPLLVHEQNARAGTTNKLLRPLACRVMQAFAGALPEASVVGNPVRMDIASLPEPQERMAARQNSMRANLLVLGGSLGALALNELVPQALAKLPEELLPNVRHQTGEKHLDFTRQCYHSAAVDGAQISAFIDDMAEAYSWADIIVCRAGALTISELTAAGLGGILIPYPWAIDDHQAKNAEVMVEAGAALMRRQDTLSAENLAADLIDLLKDKQQLVRMASQARALAKPCAAKTVAAACMELINAQSS